MTRDYSSEAVVMGSHKLRDADRVVTLFTAERGKIPTVVKGVRKVKSRFGGRLEPFSLLNVRLHEGRNLHTLTGADTIRTFAPIRDSADSLQAGLSVLDLLARTTTEHEPRPRTWNLMHNFLPALENATRGKTGGSSLLALSLAAQLKLLLLAGFLPHIDSCASCGSDSEVMNRFSAAAGGSLCNACPGESLRIAPESLAAMSFLLEHPLAQATDIDPDGGTIRDIWHCIREICRYHVGSNLKVEPWSYPPAARNSS